MYLFKNLINNLGYVILISFLISRLNSFKKIIQKENFNYIDLLVLSLTFGSFGILGTYIGTDVNGAIANTRIIGVMAGGILCGPIVGVFSGIIAGFHRYIIDIGGITSIPCLLTTIIAGIISGIIYLKASKKNIWIHGILSGILAENLTMIFILIMSKPFDLAFFIVKQIYIPMVLVNGLGIGIVILITESIFEEKEEIAAKQSKLALEIANKTLPYFRNINNNSLKKVCEIIKDSFGADAVSITDKKYILAHVGLGEDHHLEGGKILTESTETVIKDGKISLLKSSSQINCMNKEDSITFRDEALAVGLSHIISTQLEIGKLKKMEEMADKAEIKALQAQINPHFLFNALNTIVSFVRIDPNKARELIINLSTYLRHNLENEGSFIDIYKEINQVKAYVEIEKARFKDKLKVIYCIDENINIKIPSLIIQPLVENSIKHGILEGKGSGVVKITIKKLENDEVKIDIEDDGIGIDENIIKEIYKGTIKENKIGLINVHNRLKLIYKTGLDIKRLESGTEISFIVS